MHDGELGVEGLRERARDLEYRVIEPRRLGVPMQRVDTSQHPRVARKIWILYDEQRTGRLHHQAPVQIGETDTRTSFVTVRADHENVRAPLPGLGEDHIVDRESPTYRGIDAHPPVRQRLTELLQMSTLRAHQPRLGGERLSILPHEPRPDLRLVDATHQTQLGPETLGEKPGVMGRQRQPLLSGFQCD